MLFSASFPTAFAQENNIKAGKVSISSGVLNIRKSATTNSKVLKTFKNGRFLTIIGESGNWWHIKFGEEKYGFASKNYIDVLEESRGGFVKTNGGNLNVRSGAGTQFSVKKQLKNGEKVVILAPKNAKNGFFRIVFNGFHTGFVHKNYISFAQNQSNPTTEISLSVPDFKQTDSRWANVKIGSSGKTIGKIGCATTAVAMMESYRENKTIYPDAMSKKLSYSSSGNLYWPSHYTPVTNSINYLSVFKQKLSQNKPVLFGAKTNAGGQHWVVVKGFKGGNLTAENFLINDPGSKSRKTLKQFLNDYPNFYKFFYY